MVNDPRLGRITPEQVTFPEVSISGNTYQRPAPTLAIGDGYFVALDIGSDPDEQTLADLRVLIAPKSKKAKEVEVDGAEPVSSSL